jgi:hypothetical protein
MNEAIPVVFVVGFLALAFVTIVRALFDHLRRSRAEKVQAEMFGKLMDKLGSGQEVLSYLNTDVGRNLMKQAEAAQPAPFSRILNSAQYGVICLVLGIGIFLMRGIANQGVEANEAISILGTLVTAMGAGLLAAAAGSYWLSKKLGLLAPGTPEQNA